MVTVGSGCKKLASQSKGGLHVLGCIGLGERLMQVAFLR